MTNYTLITGASKGIGKAIAIEAANRGMNLILVARSKELLDQLAAELKPKQVEVRVIALDLFREDAAEAIFTFLKNNGLQVNMLVNNAGIGHLGSFSYIPLEKHLQLMRLNMDVCVKLAHGFLNNTDTTNRRYILNVVSMAAYQPLPGMNIYASSKAFMMYFSRALRHELRHKNVYVTALCPGGVESEFHIPAGLEKVVEKNARFMMSADTVAKAALDAVMKNKSVVIPGFSNKIAALAAKIFPHDLVVKFAARIYET